MSTYEWVLFLHVASAFALVAAMIVFWAGAIALAGGRAGTATFVPALIAPANVLVILGVLGTVAFGVWLALDEYSIADGWIVASLVLWAVGTETGRRAGAAFQRTQGGADGVAYRQAILLHSISSASVLAILVLMIFKPGA